MNTTTWNQRSTLMDIYAAYCKLPTESRLKLLYYLFPEKDTTDSAFAEEAYAVRYDRMCALDRDVREAAKALLHWTSNELLNRQPDPKADVQPKAHNWLRFSQRRPK